MTQPQFEYDIALSFAEEDASIALNIYLALKLLQGDNSVFFYKKNLHTSGKLLKSELPSLYKFKARYVVMLVSESYVNKDKIYAPIESNAIIERWKFNPEDSFLIPVRIDQTPLSTVDSSLSKEVAYARWNGDPEDLAEKIWELVRMNTPCETTNSSTQPETNSSSGEPTILSLIHI